MTNPPAKSLPQDSALARAVLPVSLTAGLAPGLVLAASSPEPLVQIAAAVLSAVGVSGMLWRSRRQAQLIQALTLQSRCASERAEAAEREAERALRTSAEATAEAIAKSNFLATMSHEIRTPMNGIIGTAELLADEVATDDGHTLVHTIQSCSMALLGVINDILDFSKIEAGRLELDQSDFAPAQLLEELADLLAAQAHAKGVEMLCTVDEQLPALVCGDPARLRQVLTNLLSNAVKFTRSGAIVVSAEVCSYSEQEVAVRFAVEDTGIGIPSDKLSQVFKSYIQADPSIPRTFGGTGLGLSISSQLVELMGGQLEVESTQGVGSRFFFTTTFEIRQTTPESRDAVLAGRRILYVEANPRGRQQAAALIRSLGGETELSDNAMEALRQALVARQLGLPLDMIVLDRQLPGLDGLQLAQMLSSQPETADIPLVLTTLKTDIPPREALEAAGISAVLARPLLRSRCERTLGRLLPSVPSAETAERPPPAAAEPPPPPAPTAPPPPVLEPRASKDTGRPRVLLADDSDFNLTLLSMQLDKLGFDVDMVPHGRAAVERFFQGSYAVVLMDCQMPEMSGYQAATEIRRREQGTRTPIIALTADVLPDVRDRCLEAGMDDYLSKPVWLQALGELLNRWLDNVEKVA